KASVCDEQLLQRQPDLPSRLVDWDLAVIACVCSKAISPPQQEDKDDSSAGAAPIDIRGHPTGVRCTDLHSEPAQRASAVIRRLGTNRVAAGAMNARQPNRTISGRAGSRNGEMPIHR